MKIGKQIEQVITSILLLIALMLPTTVEFFHAFESHEHIACNEKSTSIYQSVSKCHICDFNLVVFNDDIVDFTELLVSSIPIKIEKSFSSLLFHSFKTTNTQLRAPPYFLA